MIPRVQPWDPVPPGKGMLTSTWVHQPGQALPQGKTESLEIATQLEQKLQEDLIRTVMKLRLVKVNEGMQQMRFLLEEMMEQSETEINPYQDLILRYTLLRGRLDQALGCPIKLD